MRETSGAAVAAGPRLRPAHTLTGTRGVRAGVLSVLKFSGLDLQASQMERFPNPPGLTCPFAKVPRKRIARLLDETQPINLLIKWRVFLCGGSEKYYTFQIKSS